MALGRYARPKIERVRISAHQSHNVRVGRFRPSARRKPTIRDTDADVTRATDKVLPPEWVKYIRSLG